MDEGGVRPRSNLEKLTHYVAGKRPAQVAGHEGRVAIKLASNETPFPPHEAVLLSVQRAASELNRYPDITSRAVTEAIARRYGLEPAQVTVNTGSVALIHNLIDAVAGSGDEVVYAWPSFNAYVRAVTIAGAISVQVPLTDHRHDLKAMATAITERTKVVIVCNPNNPTSTVVGGDELESFLDAIDSRVLVVLDEAYREFVTDPRARDGISLMAGRENVAILRTFSKAFGLAGLRLGFCATSPALTDVLRRLVYPFAVSSVAQAAAITCLDKAVEQDLMARVDFVIQERSRVEGGLRGLGYEVPHSETNFVWVPVSDAAEFAQELEAAGVIVRPMGSGVRITIGTSEENDALISAVRELTSRHAPNTTTLGEPTGGSST